MMDRDVEELIVIDDDFNKAIARLGERELRDKLFLMAHMLRMASERDGSSKRAAADYVLGFLRIGKFR